MNILCSIETGKLSKLLLRRGLIAVEEHETMFLKLVLYF